MLVHLCGACRDGARAFAPDHRRPQAAAAGEGGRRPLSGGGCLPFRARPISAVIEEPFEAKLLCRATPSPCPRFIIRRQADLAWVQVPKVLDLSTVMSDFKANKFKVCVAESLWPLLHFETPSKRSMTRGPDPLFLKPAAPQQNADTLGRYAYTTTPCHSFSAAACAAVHGKVLYTHVQNHTNIIIHIQKPRLTSPTPDS